MKTVCKVLIFFLISNTGGWNQSLSLLGKKHFKWYKISIFSYQFHLFFDNFVYVCYASWLCSPSTIFYHPPKSVTLPALQNISWVYVFFVLFCFLTILRLSLSSFWPWFEATGYITDGYDSSLLTASTPNILRITMLGDGRKQEEGGRENSS